MTEILYSGLAVGGPMDGQEIEGRYPGGILFVSKPTDRAWLYDFYAEQGKFYVRPLGYDAVWNEMTNDQKLKVIDELAELDATRELDYDKRLEAAESTNTEIRALPDEAGE